MTDDELDALLERLEADLTDDVSDALNSVAEEFLNAVDDATELVAARFSVSRIRDMWRRRVNPIVSRLRGTAEVAAQATADDLGGEVTAEEVEEQLGDYVEETTALLNAVGDRLANEATSALAEGLNNGEDLDQLKERLTALFTGDPDGTQLGDGRARRIAMTEATRAWNAGTLAAAQALTGPERPLVKQWVTRMDDRVRPAHREANGQIQLLDDPFDVGGNPMRYPGDPAAPASQTINCRCIMRAATATARDTDVTADASDQEFQSRMPAQLKAYWLAGPGAARIGWGTPGSFTRCVRELRDEFPENTEGLCANLYHEATGHWPGQKNSSEVSHLSGAMIALMPTEADAARLALDGGEVAEQLHLTLFTLGEGADWSPDDRERIARNVRRAIRGIGPVTARAFGAAQWNPGGDNPPWVWNVGDATDVEGPRLVDAYNVALIAMDGLEMPVQYQPWAPHICAGYTGDDLMPQMIERVGTVTFDRMRVAFAGDYYDFELSHGPYRVGDRVRVAGDPHESGHSAGTIEEISDGPAYGVVFDGTDEIHHWYVADELMPEEDTDEVEPVPEYGDMPRTINWSTPSGMGLAFENQQTGDGRLFTPGALYWETGPWPLQYADEMNGGHDGARLAGAIADMWREEDRLAGHGVIYLNQQAGVEAAMLLSQGAPLGVSVDLDDVDVEVLDTGDTDEVAYTAHLVTASLLPMEDGWYLTGETATHWTAAGTSLAGESTKIAYRIGADGTVPAEAFEIAAAAGDGDVPGGQVLERQTSGSMLMRITRARVRGATLVTIPAFAAARIALNDESMFACGFKEITADAARNDYERVVRYVRKAFMPVDAPSASRFLGLPVTVVRKHLATAAQKGAIVRLARGYYTKPNMSDVPGEPAPVDSEAEGLDIYASSLTAAATGSVDLPVADRSAPWDGDGAKDRVFDWADGDTDKISRAFAYRDDDADPTTKAAYKLGYADVVDGTLTIVPRGVFAAQAAVNGARGGADLKGDTQAVEAKLNAVRAHVDEVTGGDGDEMEASAWSAMKDLPAMPAAWFAEPTMEELPPGGAGVNYKDGRIFGWVAQAGEPHAGFAKKITIDGLGRIDTTHFLRQRFTLDDGSTVKAGAYTMNAGHHRDGAECETAACQFDDTRFVAGIVTVGMNERGMWFSGAAAPWLSTWDRQVFMSCQPSYHLRKGANGNWQLRAVLSVPVPGHSSPLLASAVAERAQMALTAAAQMAEVEEAVTKAQAVLSEPAPVVDLVASIDYDRLADSMVAAMARAEERKASEAAELAALLEEARNMVSDTDGTNKGRG